MERKARKARKEKKGRRRRRKERERRKERREKREMRYAHSKLIEKSLLSEYNLYAELAVGIVA